MTNSFDFIIRSDGIYGLFRNEPEKMHCDWWCLNKGLAMGLLGGLLLIGLLIAAFIYFLKATFIEKFVEVNLDLNIVKVEDKGKTIFFFNYKTPNV
jgi:hypothetical protein